MTAPIDVRPLKERQREQREQLILQAAEELFLERGFYETSVDDIAARVGIAKGTVYLHFPSKEDLAIALCEKGMGKFADTMDAILDSDAPPRDKLRSILRQVYGGMLTKHSQLLMSIFQNPELRSRLSNDRASQHERWHELGMRMREELNQRMCAVFDDGKATGDFDPTIPTSVMLALFTGLMVSIRFPTLFVRDQMTTDEVVWHLSRCLFRAIATPNARQEDI